MNASALPISSRTPRGLHRTKRVAIGRGLIIRLKSFSLSLTTTAPANRRSRYGVLAVRSGIEQSVPPPPNNATAATIGASSVGHFCVKTEAIPIDKATAVKMYDRVQAEWGRRIEGVRAEVAASVPVCTEQSNLLMLQIPPSAIEATRSIHAVLGDVQHFIRTAMCEHVAAAPADDEQRCETGEDR